MTTERELHKNAVGRKLWVRDPSAGLEAEVEFVVGDDLKLYETGERRKASSWQPPAPRTELIWAAVDLDGTLAEGVWTPESNGREIGAPIQRNIDKLEELREAGYKIVIHTARGWEHYQSIESWLQYHDVHADRIVCGKLLAAVYVDDRAVESEQWNWLPAAQKLRQYQLRRQCETYYE